MDYPREPEPPAAGPVFAENSGKIRYDFSYGSVNTRYFPFREWKRCFDDALLRLENDDYLRYPLRPGCEELRETLASYFNQSLPAAEYGNHIRDVSEGNTYSGL